MGKKKCKRTTKKESNTERTVVTIAPTVTTQDNEMSKESSASEGDKKLSKYLAKIKEDEEQTKQAAPEPEKKSRSKKSSSTKSQKIKLQRNEKKSDSSSTAGAKTNLHTSDDSFKSKEESLKNLSSPVEKVSTSQRMETSKGEDNWTNANSFEDTNKISKTKQNINRNNSNTSASGSRGMRRQGENNWGNLSIGTSTDSNKFSASENAYSSSQGKPYRSNTGSSFDNSMQRNWNNSRRSYDSRDSRDSRNYSGNFDKEFNDFLHALKSPNKIINEKYKEMQGDLFEAPPEYSLAHCVAEDMAMGAGIAVTFRKKFGLVGYLLNQNQKTGGLAVLQDSNRYIYYLVTKERSQGKPTLYTLWLSLLKMKAHCLEHDVKRLAMPQIGCGRDHLKWYEVSKMLKYLFKDVDIEIVIYILREAEPDKETPTKNKCFVNNTSIHLRDMQSGTGLIYFGTANGDVSAEMESLGTKYKFIPDYQATSKTVGDVVRKEDKNEIIYGLIIRKSMQDKINFEDFERCLLHLRNLIKKDEYYYIAFESLVDKDDNLITEKIVNLMQHNLKNVEIWVCGRTPPAP